MESIIEDWKPVANWPGYEVSSLGNVRSLDRHITTRTNVRFYKGRILKPTKLKDGYNGVSFSGKRTYKIHRLVAQAFIPNPEAKLEVNHKNGNKLDNRVENLEWSTRAENARHAALNGLMAAGERGPYAVHDDAKVSAIKAAIKANPEMRHADVGAMFGVSQTYVSMVARGWRTTLRRCEIKRRPQATPEVIRAIRSAVGTQKELVARFGMSYPNIYLIKARKIWRHVE